ncbi:MAG: GntR family transcriptional regulator [Ruminococcus sp.]|nr:GntR family transcriptional regulator [Ruminococcus sp.]
MQWPPDSKIPSENELRSSLSVSRDTVREAIKRLGALGLLESK